MKPFLLIAALFGLTSGLWSQPLPKMRGDIKVSIINHDFLRNKHYEFTKKTSNRENRPRQQVFFDRTGKLQIHVWFGWHHNTSYDVIGMLNQYTYDSVGLPVRIDTWRTESSEGIAYKYYQKFYTDSTTRIKSDTVFYAANDSASHSHAFWHDEKWRYQGSYSSPDYHYERDYDSLNRVVAIREMSYSKIRRTWIYNYTDTSRIVMQHNYYIDDKHPYEKKVTIFKDGEISEIETFASTEGSKNKLKFNYDKLGLLIRIEHHETHAYGQDYRFEYYTDIKIKAKCKITPDIVNSINDKLFERYLITD